MYSIADFEFWAVKHLRRNILDLRHEIDLSYNFAAEKESLNKSTINQLYTLEC
jgi:hypothetical protein